MPMLLLSPSLRSCAAALLLPCAATPARAQGSDSAAVIGVVGQLFHALAMRDTVAMRVLLVPGTRFTAVRRDSLGTQLRVQPDSAFLRAIARPGPRMLERMWDATARVHGPIATVWTPYDFHVDGRRSHCGVDAVTLVRGATGWQVSDLTCTVETTGCTDSPLGPPPREPGASSDG